MMPKQKRRFKLSLLFLGLIVLISWQPLHAQAPELGECDQEVEEIASNQLPKAIRSWNQKNYREAERYLEKALRYDAHYADALYLLGELKLRQREIVKTQFLWSLLVEECPNYKPEIPYFLGVMYLEDNKLNKAIPLIEQFLANPERDFGYDKEAKAALEEAKLKKSLLENTVAFDPKPVQRISTTADEYLATISPDQRTIYFTRRSRKVNRKAGPATTARLVEEFCASSLQASGQFEEGAPLPSPFNTSYNEGGPSITADNTELYFTVCEDLDGYKNCDIYYTEKDAYGYWSTPRSVGDHINRIDSWESQASITANGDWLYFTSDREGGVGGLDLYRCHRLEDGTWSAPDLLDGRVNTRYDEKSPFIHSDSQTLYFTSNGHPGLGGFDIFYAKAIDSTWQAPSNIGYPINGEEDDLGLFVSLDGKTGYFSSNSLRANTGWDLYSFEMPEAARPEEVFLVQGNLDVAEGASLEDATVKIKNLKTKELTEVKVDLETGSFARVVKREEASDYIVKVEKKGAAFSSRYLSADELKLRPNVETSLELAPMEVGREYTLNDIQFESNSSKLNPAARSIIEEFALFMKDNPELSADIQGHTDDVGDDESNLRLSKARAQAVYEYAISIGIEASRLSWHGYGEGKPLADNATEEGRAKNRRTVFVITAQ
jgi:outer membrane protein OmpA-like peptidoglycan-associated protein/tetratricopeptide (TPR) repeat protein